MSQSSLFVDDTSLQPLAERVRPKTLANYIGQSHLLGKNKPLSNIINSGLCSSMILWGPPGTGKTTLVRMFVDIFQSEFLSISAAISGLSDIRAAIEQAKTYSHQGKQTILFVDEIHRFNKSQQDIFLPYVEDGTIVLIGATTENPSFELNSSLLSRLRVYVLKKLTTPEIKKILSLALINDDILLGQNIALDPDVLSKIAQVSDGDARRALGYLELSLNAVVEDAGVKKLKMSHVKDIMGDGVRNFDKNGDEFYEQISALHKSIRGSNPDGALYWLCRMLDGGADPLYLARRLIRIASEDIGNADPRALGIAVDASNAYERLGSPEGELSLAQCAVYLAVAAKSNAVYVAFNSVRETIKNSGSIRVPEHLRNAPTSLMKDLGYGKKYRYAHDEPESYAAGETYLPEDLIGHVFYKPSERGLEVKISAKMQYLSSLDQEVLNK